MALHDIEITAMTRVALPRPNRNGDKIIAYLTLRIGPVEMVGCALIQRENGYVTVWPPRVANENGNRMVSIVDHDAKKQTIMAASSAFEAMGGSFTKTEIDLPLR